MVFGVDLDEQEKHSHQKRSASVSGRLSYDPTEAREGTASASGKCWYDEHILYSMLYVVYH